MPKPRIITIIPRLRKKLPIKFEKACENPVKIRMIRTPAKIVQIKPKKGLKS